MKFMRDADNRDPNLETHVEWQYNGHPCTGVYQPTTNAMVFNFHLKASTVVITYRVLDQNSQ